MRTLIGTSEGLFVTQKSGEATPTAGLEREGVRHLTRIGNEIFAGTDAGLFRSGDDGRSWMPSGIEGRMVWATVPSPDDPHVLYAGTEPAALFVSRDGGRSWDEVESFRDAPGFGVWCLPGTPPRKARARTIVMDADDPTRCWVGVEVGGVVRSDDQTKTWSTVLPGGNPDIHVLVHHPARANVLFASTGLGRIDNSEPREQRIAGMFRSDDGGKSWRFLSEKMRPRYTRPLCIDSRAPCAVTVACAPSAFSSFRDDGGAKAMLYQSDDGGETWRSLGDSAHSPSTANFHAVAPDRDRAGGVMVGTDTGEVWKVSRDGEWALVVDRLPLVQSLLPLD